MSDTITNPHARDHFYKTLSGQSLTDIIEESCQIQNQMIAEANKILAEKNKAKTN